MFPADTSILIVDDIAVERKRLRHFLGEMGYSNFTEASDGNMAFQLLTEANGKIGLVLSDLNMAFCDGLELLKKIRGSAQFSNLPFAIFSTESERAVIIDAMMAGCSGYLIKPVSPEVLKAKLSKIHERYAREGQS
jgi:two-component system chemotaxis response regulator CheY